MNNPRPTTRFSRADKVGNDVHTYTRYFKELIPSVKPLIGSVSAHEFLSVVSELNTFCTNCSCPCHIALTNMIRQYEAQRGLIDPHLQNLDVSALLVRCSHYANENDESDLLHEAMMDIGGTCRQGQSHRLLFLFLAYHKLY
jgi:hypothetical protein